MNNRFLATIPTELGSRLLQNADEITHPPGSLIDGRHFGSRPGVVVDGQMRAYFTNRDGREATVFYLEPGDAIGLVAMFGAAPNINLQAVTETRILYFDAVRFENLLSTEIALAHSVAASLADRLLTSTESFKGIVFGRVRSRVADHLLRMAVRDGHGRLVARVTQQGLANAVGSVRDVVARVLRELRGEGLVITSHGRVLLTDEEGLKREASLL
jgi:CRP/FNR family transcriptional regulator